MSLTTDEIGLLRSLVEWRRKNGWTHNFHRWDGEQHDHAYDHNQSGLSVEVDMHRIELFPGEPKVLYEIRVDQAGHLLFHGWPWSVRSAVDGIASAAVIPPEMAPMYAFAFQFGRESVYDRDEWRVAFDSGLSMPSGGEGDLGYFRWVVSQREDAHLEHCRTGATDWERVPEAGGPDGE